MALLKRLQGKECLRELPPETRPVAANQSTRADCMACSCLAESAYEIDP
jgi:hypothetical protein